MLHSAVISMMKKNSLCLLTVLGIANWSSPTALAVGGDELSGAILLPGSRSVSVEYAFSTHPVQISSIRSIPAETRLSLENDDPVNVLCPGLRLTTISPGELMTCPDAETEDIRLMAENSSPPLLPDDEPLIPVRGPDEIMALEREEAQRLDKLRERVQTLSLSNEERLFLEAWLYESAGSYHEAIASLEATDLSEAPALLHSLGRLYIKTGSDGYRRSAQYFFQAAQAFEAKGDREGQAAALHYTALLAAALGQSEAARQQAEKALEAYRELGFEREIDALNRLQEKL